MARADGDGRRRLAPAHLPDPWVVPGGDERLRLPTPDDVPGLVAGATDPDVAYFTRVPHPYDEQDARAFISEAHRTWEDDAGVLVVVVGGPDGTQVLGTGALHVDRRDHSADVGYWLAPAGRGRGLATRVAHELLRYGFEELGVQAATLHHVVQNEGSRRIALRLGFRPVGTYRGAASVGPTGDPDAERADLAAYDLLPSELGPPPSR